MPQQLLVVRAVLRHMGSNASGAALQAGAPHRPGRTRATGTHPGACQVCMGHTCSSAAVQRSTVRCTRHRWRAKLYSLYTLVLHGDGTSLITPQHLSAESDLPLTLFLARAVLEHSLDDFLPVMLHTPAAAQHGYCMHCTQNSTGLCVAPHCALCIAPRRATHAPTADRHHGTGRVFSSSRTAACAAACCTALLAALSASNVPQQVRAASGESSPGTGRSTAAPVNCTLLLPGLSAHKNQEVPAIHRTAKPWSTAASPTSSCGPLYSPQPTNAPRSNPTSSFPLPANRRPA